MSALGSPRPFNRVPSRNLWLHQPDWTDPTVVLTEGWGSERPDTAASGWLSHRREFASAGGSAPPRRRRLQAKKPPPFTRRER